MKRAVVLLALLAALTIAASGCGSSSHATQPIRQIPQLQSIAQLRHDFNAHLGEPRLILLISPT